MLTLSFIFVAFGGSPIRDFFQISSDANNESDSAFRLPKLRLDVLSSSDSTVRSITCASENPLVGICLARDGDNSRLTSPSSSSSESKTTTSPDLWLFSWFEASRIWPEGLSDGAGCFGCGVGLTGSGLWVFLQASEAYLSSDVCHSPSASTITSSTVSGVLSKIELKYLRSYQWQESG